MVNVVARPAVGSVIGVVVVLGGLALACSGGGGGAPVAPAGLAYATPSATYHVGVPIEANAPSVGGAVERFEVAPALPSGLALDAATGVIHGAPSALQARTEHVVRASNAAGVDTAIVVIEVEPAATRMAWVVGASDGTVAALLLDAGDGAEPRLVPSGTAPSLASPLVAAAHPSGELLFVADSSAGEIAVHAVDPRDGRPAPGTLALAGLARPVDLVASPRGDALWVAETDAGAVATLSVSRGGALARVAAAAAGSAPGALALAPDGTHLFAASAATDEVASLAVGADGRLGAAELVSVPVGPVALAAAETGAVDHLLALGAGGLALLRIQSGGAPVLLGTPVAAGARPRDVFFHAESSQALVSDEGAGLLRRFALDPAAGTLSPLVPLELGGAPGALALAEGLPLLLVADAVASEVRLVELAPDGALALRGGVRTAPGPLGLALGFKAAPVEIRSEHAYFASTASARIHQFAVEHDRTQPRNAPELVPLSPPFALTRPGVRELALHPDGARVFSADGTGLALESFARDTKRGTLAPLADEHEEGVVSDLVIEPSGRFAYATLSTIRTVRAYALGQAGEIAPFADLDAGTYPERLALGPAGRVLYVTDRAADRLLALAADDDGVLAPLADVAAGEGPADVALHPSGRFAYVPNELAASLSVYVLGPDGTPESLAELASAPRPVRAAVRPNGRSLYLVHEGVNALAHWVVDPATGLAEPRATVGTLSSPLALAVAPTGRYLVVTNTQGRAVLFTLDELGEPRLAGTATVGASPRGILLPPGVR